MKGGISMDNQSQNNLQFIQKAISDNKQEQKYYDNKLEILHKYNQKNWIQKFMTIIMENILIITLCTLSITSFLLAFYTLLPLNAFIALLTSTSGIAICSAIIAYNIYQAQVDNLIKTIEDLKDINFMELENLELTEKTLLTTLDYERKDNSQEKQQVIKPINHEYDNNITKKLTKQ